MANWISKLLQKSDQPQPAAQPAPNALSKRRGPDLGKLGNDGSFGKLGNPGRNRLRNTGRAEDSGGFFNDDDDK